MELEPYQKRRLMWYQAMNDKYQTTLDAWTKNDEYEAMYFYIRR